MYVRRRSGVWEVKAPAKLNVYLEVLGRCSDGYHALETLMFPIACGDRLWFSLSESPRDRSGLTLRYHASSPLTIQQAAPCDADNLVLRAARLLATEAGVEGRGSFELLKRIPVGAGMGGGSSDAAAALRLANEAWGVGYTLPELAKLGAQLGSDVPFFLYGGPAICRGRGEEVSLVSGMPRMHVVVVVPPVRFMTADVFDRLARLPGSFASREDSSTRLTRLTDLLRGGAVGRSGRWMRNRLQSAVGEGAQWVERLEQSFIRLGCGAHLMTGSGSGYFGVARSARHARSMAARLSSWELGRVWATATGR